MIKRKNIKIILIMVVSIFLVSCSSSSVSNKIDNPKSSSFKGQAMITFSYDDGLLNNYEVALNIHEKYGVPATFNVLGKRAIKEGEHVNFMTIEMIEDSFNRGIEIASHSYSHPRLTKLPDEEIEFEMKESKKVLEDIVGKENVNTIAIPNSLYNENIKEIASKYYKGVRVWGKQNNKLNQTDFLEIQSSIAVTNTTTFEEVKNIIDEAVANKEWTVIMMHGVDEEKNDKYEVTPEFLDEVLKYVSSFDKSELLPINTYDAIKYLD